MSGEPYTTLQSQMKMKAVKRDTYRWVIVQTEPPDRLKQLLKWVQYHIERLLG